MSGMESIGNLSRSGVRPLRSTAKARPEANPVQSFSVKDLKNGGTMEMGGMLEDQKSIREQYLGNGPAPSARRSQNSQLSPQEQVEKLGKIRKSAVEYEGVFVDQLVKQMRQSPLSKTPGGDTFSDIAEQPFRDFLSQNGGIGLADTIVNQVARQEGLEQTLHSNPGIMGPNWRPTVPQNLMQKPAGNLTMTQEIPENNGEPLETQAEKTMGNFLAGIEKAIGAETQADKKSPEFFLAGIENAAGAAIKADEQPPMNAVGMMNGEEIAYLYNEAQEGLA